MYGISVFPHAWKSQDDGTAACIQNTCWGKCLIVMYFKDVAVCLVPSHINELGGMVDVINFYSEVTFIVGVLWYV